MQITDEAKTDIIQILDDNDAEGIRLFLAGIGWGGPQLGLSLEGAEENDILEVINEVRVAIDPHIKDMADTLRLEKRPRGLVLAGIPAGDC